LTGRKKLRGGGGINSLEKKLMHLKATRQRVLREEMSASSLETPDTRKEKRVKGTHFSHKVPVAVSINN